MNIKAILDKYNIEIHAERTNNYDCCCPIHHDKTPSFSINKESGLWLCRSACGSGNIITLISKLENCSFAEAKEKLGVYFDRRTLLSEKFDKLKELGFNSSFRDPLPQMEYPSGYTLIDETTERCAPSYYKYITSRIPLTIVKEFKLGYTVTGKSSGRIILPVFLNSQLIGYTARSIYTEVPKRYLIPDGCKTSKMIWGYDQEPADEAWICESIFDALTLISWGIRPVYGTFGARITDEQIRMLLSKKVKDLIICFHNDEAGIKGVEDKKELLKALFNVKSAILPPDSDINEMSREKFFSSVGFTELKNSEPINRIKTILQRKRQHETDKKPII